MPSVISDIVKATKANALLLLVFAIATAVLPLVMSGAASSTSSTWVITTILIYQLHRQVLTGFPMALSGKLLPSEWTALPKESTLRFLLVSGLLTLIAAIPAVYIAINWASKFEGEAARNQTVGMTVILVIITLWLMLSAFGTGLPAAAMGQSFSPRLIWQAGRKTGLRVAGQLILFPGLTTLILLAFAFGLDWVLGPRVQAQPMAFVIEVIFGALSMLPSVMTVVILVRAYRSAYPQT